MGGALSGRVVWKFEGGVGWRFQTWILGRL